jgi:hypothetical protein
MESEILSYREERRVEEFINVTDIIKKAIINYLGLNLMLIEDKDTGLIRPPTENEITPLAALIASPELLSEVGKKYKEYQTQQDAIEGLNKEYGDGESDFENESKALMFDTPEELDEFMKSVNDPSSDIEFLDDPEELMKIKWNEKFLSEGLGSLIESEEDLNLLEEIEEDEGNKSRRSLKVVVD